MIRYGVDIIFWKKDKLEVIDRKTRKLLSIYQTLIIQITLRDYINLPRQIGGKGLISVEDRVNPLTPGRDDT